MVKKIMLLAMLSVALISCNNKKNDAELVEQLSSSEYVYKGVLPAPDCAGKDVTLSFDKSANVVCKTHFIGQDATTVANGSYEVKDAILTVTLENEVLKFRATADELTLLDENGNELKGEDGANFVLKREAAAFDFVGTYSKTENDMEISFSIAQDGENYKVAILPSQEECKKDAECKEECAKECKEGKECKEACKEECKDACDGQCEGCKVSHEFTAKLIDGNLEVCKADDTQTKLFSIIPNEAQTGVIIKFAEDAGNCPFAGEYLKK